MSVSFEESVDCTQPKEHIAGLPDFGWRVKLNYKCRQKCKPFTRPRLSQLPALAGLGLRYSIFWIKKRRRGKRPFIDHGNLVGYLPIYGVPIGGLGCGTIGRGYRGEFCRYQMVPGMYKYKILFANQFIVCIRKNGETVYQQVLSPLKQKSSALKAWKWEYPGEHGTYHALYPRSWTVYNLPDQNIRLICRQISPVYPHEYQDTCYPTAVFVWEVENKNTDDVQVSIAFTFQNGNGSQADRLGGVTSAPYQIEEDGCQVSGMMIHQHFKGMPCTYGIAAKQTDDITVTQKMRFDPCGDGRELWEELKQKGHFQPLEADHHSEPTRKGQMLGVAICAQCTVKGMSSAQIDMSLVWDMPVVHFGANKQMYHRRYARWHGYNGDAAPSLSSYALRHFPMWEKKIEEWQNPVINNSHVPAWYKSALFNELYYLSDGGTVWLDPAYPSEYKTSIDVSESALDHFREYGKFGYLEGQEYRMYNTYDVHYYASFAMIMLWPKLQLSIQYDIAEAIMMSMPKRVRFLVCGTVGPIKVASTVPHDLGDPDDEPWINVNAYQAFPTHDWKDLNLKFVLQTYRDYVAIQNEDYLHDMYPLVKAVMEYSLQWDTDGDGLIENSGYPDQTFDAWGASGVSAYCGGMWLAALRMTIEMASLLSHTEDVERFANILSKGSTSFEHKLWTGSYYKYDTGSDSHHDSIMADQLCGQWYLKASNLADGSIFPPDHVKSALKKVYDFNVMTFHDGKMGAINGMRPNKKKDRSSAQAEEFWVGVTYSLAATMIQEGMIEEGFRTASGPYHVCYEWLGLAFQTPEAYFDNKCYRSLGYMRPLCIWSIQWALEKFQPQFWQKKNNASGDAGGEATS